jgi:NAD(P)-dependent dehydrogenase (short-subunit alcohol dehydrogenase family)
MKHSERSNPPQASLRSQSQLLDNRFVRLRDKVAIVTGAARGVGEAVASKMAAEGACVVAVDMLEAEVEGVVSRISADGHEASALVADVATREGNERAVDLAKSRYGGVDVFHANAAIIRFSDIVATTETVWDDIQRVNLKGVYLGCQAAIPAMTERGGGSLILTASVLAFVGDPELSAYGAAKGGMRALCRSIAVACGPKNIRCNTICPGDVHTPMLMTFLASQVDATLALKKMTDAYPLQRIATPADVANAAVFLASDESRNITGTDLIVDCGLLAKCY